MQILKTWGEKLFVAISFLATINSFSSVSAQTCNNWLRTNASFESVTVGDLDVSGNQITVEALITRTQPWTGGYNYAGDIVSKHDLPNNVNYLLRPNNAEITTTNGYKSTPPVCLIELNKTYHVAMVYDGAFLKFYRNGFLMSQVACTGNMVNNNFLTTIGDYAYPNPVGTNFRGYINEVRIWNVARTELELRNNMMTLPSPTTQTGLLAYYTFDNLINKQGNAAYNGTLNSAATINNTNPNCLSAGSNCMTSANIIQNSDTTICLGSSVQLNTNGVYEASWFPTQFLFDPTAINPIATPTQDVTYVLTATTVGNNLVANSDFSAGNTGFISDYTYNTSGIPAGVYFVGTNSQAWHPGMPSCNDHTTGNGNMLMVNGSTQLNVVVWSQTVPVTPNTNYAFSTWIQNITTVNPALLQFSINGVNLGTPFRANNQFCLWERFHTIWNSGANTTATISIVNQNQVLSGNDFALDDITFAPTIILTDSVRITVSEANVSTISDSTICAGQAVQLNTTGALDFTWTPPTGLNNPSAQNPVATPSVTTLYEVTGVNNFGCTDKDSVLITVEEKPTLVPLLDTSICAGNTLQLNSITNASTISWQPPGSFSNPVSFNPIYTGPGNEQVIVTAFSTNGCLTRDTLNITINPGYNISESLEICTGQLPYLWNSQSLSAPGNYIANLVSADGCDSTINLTLSILDTLRSNEALSVCNDLLPYIWNSQSLNSSGTYTAFLTSAAGCDSMVVMNFQVKNATTSLNTQTICSSQTPLIWNGQSLNTSGTFTANLINAAGCDSTATLQLTVNPVANSTTTLAICSNQTPFAWNGQNYTSGGTYTVNLTASNGCDSLAQLNLTVNPIRNSNTNVAICDDLLPYSWNGQSYSAAGAYSVNLTSSLGCDSIANLNLEVHHPQTSNTTLTICSAQVPYTWNGININAAGNYIANLQSAAGCDSTANLTLSVLDTLFENRSQVICADAFPLMWNGQQINAPGNYAHNLMAVSGCDSVITLQLSTHNYQPLNAIPDTAVCRGASVQLFVTGAGFNNFQWSPGTQLTGANSSTPTFTGNLNTQMIRVIATDNNGCLSADSVLITLREPPLVLAGNDTVACNMQPVQLNAQGASTYVWSPAANFNNYQIANPAFTGTVSSALTVTGTDIYGCSSIDSLWMEVRSAAALLAPPGTGMCPGGQVQLDGANGNAYTYLWSPAATIQNPNIINPIATPTSTTTYTVSITDPVCLFTRDFPVLVEVFPLPDIRLTKPSDITCTQREVVLTASGGQSYVWLPAHGLIQSSGANATVSPTRDTRYTVRGTDSRGCSDSASVDVKMLALDGLFYLPNAFTPNGDGLNECFGALHWGAVTNFKLMIFNRWGEKVFETTNPGICWDGIYKGKPSQVGNYVYHVIGQTGCGKMERKGNVLLLR